MLPLENISRYKVEKILGRGAVGTVYKAYDPVINQAVAIKVIHKQLLEQDDSGEQLQRFRNEVLAGRRLKHPNIVSIYEYGEERDVAFIIMEFIEGRQLKDFLDENASIDLESVHKIMQQLLAALNYAHEQGIVHRDIKPANIMIMKNWRIQVADFGIAKIESSSMTQTGMIMGTPNYMSPEQCLGERIDHRTDIFSAGVVFYHLLTGKRPFESATMMGTLQQVLKDTPVTPSKLNQHVSPVLDKIIDKAIAKNPENRFQSAHEFSDALDWAMKAENFQTLAAHVDDATVITPKSWPNAKADGDAKTHGKAVQKNALTKPWKYKWISLISAGVLSVVIIGLAIQNTYKQPNEKTVSPIEEPIIVNPPDEVHLEPLSNTDAISKIPTETPVETTPASSIAKPLTEAVVSIPENNRALTLATGKPDYKIGETLKVNFSVTEPLYVRIVVINSKGDAVTLFPNPYQKNSYCKPGKNYSIPPKGARFTLDIGAPTGTDKIRAIASKTPIPADVMAFTQDGQFDDSKMAGYTIRAATDYVIHR
jgi:serine/threonine protein kinase